MRRFFTSDLHLSHVNISAYTGRPFGAGSDEVWRMNRYLIDRWNEVVADDDEVWVLGDVAMG